MAINHISLRAADLEKSKEFFSKALAPLGYKLLVEHDSCIGFGTQDVEGKRDVWIHAGDTVWLHEISENPVKCFSCLAFTANNKEEVENFYKSALEAGGTDNGGPGYRKKYHPGYYAAFVLDPDGNNIEAVFDDI